VEDLSGLTEVVRRVIATKVDQPQLVEDLTQETLLHLASTSRDLASNERQAYAIVTARNLVTDHARRQAVHSRHLHRLVDTPADLTPEQHALDQEETVALAQALERLAPSDRALLIRHEINGDSIDNLAAEARSSSRAVANLLARARATLRVEFTLAHRHTHLPTDACRPVLLALSTGDRRRQQQLDARRHVQRCPTCADLAEPIAQRRRRFAAWLLFPFVNCGRRIIHSLRHNHRTQAATAAVVVTAGVVTALAITRPDHPSPATAPPPLPATATTTAATTTTAPSTTAPQPTCPTPVPLDQSAALPPIGCPIAPTAFTATEVPADEGFWAHDSTGVLVWIQLVGTDESPIRITPGTTITAAATLADPGSVPEVAADQRTIARGFVLTVRYEDITPS
jgi:RNA polymerase sigma factor (sigma-70 family)